MKEISKDIHLHARFFVYAREILRKRTQACTKNFQALTLFTILHKSNLRMHKLQ